jgi:hypothetical protein
LRAANIGRHRASIATAGREFSICRFSSWKCPSSASRQRRPFLQYRARAGQWLHWIKVKKLPRCRQYAGQGRLMMKSIVGCGFLIYPTIDGLNEQGRMRQPVPRGKRIDAGQRGTGTARSTCTVGHLNGSQKQCIAWLDRITNGWDANCMIGFEQMIDVQ